MTSGTSSDAALVAEARRIISLRFQEDRHHVGAALRTRSGKVYSAVHLEAYVGRIAVCAEAIALGMAAAAGDTAIDTIVAVNRRGEIVSPCGMCRELVSDYAPDAKVLLATGDAWVEALESIEAVDVLSLLPRKYRRNE